MPRRERHIEVGVLVAIIVVVLLLLAAKEQNRPIVEAIGAGLGVLGGALLPDILEPANTPNHRKTCHSVAALAGNGALTLTPPAAVLKWRHSLRGRAAELRAEREALPPDHPRCSRLWLQEVGCHLLIGASIGLPIGYVSHLIEDSKTSPLPPI